MLWVLPVPFDAQRPGSHHSVIPAVISIMSSNGLTFPHSAVLDNGWGFKVTQRVCVIDRDPRNGGEHFAQVVWVACVTWNAFTLPEGTLQYRVHSSSVCQTLRTILVFRGICFPVWIPVWPLSCLLASSISGFIPHPLFSFLFLQVSFWGFFFPIPLDIFLFDLILSDFLSDKTWYNAQRITDKAKPFVCHGHCCGPRISFVLVYLFSSPPSPFLFQWPFTLHPPGF